MPTAADGGGRKAGEVRARAAEQSKAESHARMDAEINLRLEQMGLTEAGPAREAKLAALPAGLAAEVRARLAVLEGQHFDPQRVLAADKVAKPNAVAASKQLASSVLPDAPAADAVRPYGPQDVVVVRELEVQLTAIAGAGILVCLLIGMIAGLGTVVAYLVDPQIRAWNRISVHIACLALVALGVAINALLGGMRLRRPDGRIAVGMFTALITLGETST